MSSKELRMSKVDRHNAARPVDCPAGHEPGGDGNARLVLFIGADIGKIGRDRGNAAGAVPCQFAHDSIFFIPPRLLSPNAGTLSNNTTRFLPMTAFILTPYHHHDHRTPQHHKILRGHHQNAGAEEHQPDL